MQEILKQLHAQQQIQDLIAKGAPLQDALNAICRMLEEQSPGALCSIMLHDPDSNTLSLKASVSLPEEYCAYMHAIPVGEGMGACGNAAFVRDLTVTEDIQQARGWRRFHALAQKHDLHACWSYPVLASDERLLGTFATYYHHAGCPDSDDMEKMIRAAGLVALAIERHLDRKALQESETQLRILQRSVESSINGVIITDAQQPDQPIIYVNSTFLNITGYTRDEVMGRNCRFLQGTDTDPQTLDLLRRNLSLERETHVTLLNYRKDGTPFWNDLYVAPVRDEDGRVTHFIGVQHDVSENRNYEARLAYHASHDALTGLPNRTLLEDRLIHDYQLAQRHHTLLAVLFIDLDEFKPINDSLGHAVGDKLLIEVAARLSALLHPGDTLARISGDEFVLLLPDIGGEEQVQDFAEQVIHRIGQPYMLEGNALSISCSIGIASSADSIKKPVELIQLADMAMYQAKKQGRNTCHWYTQDITHSISDRVTLRRDLQEAIESTQFELHYQPLIHSRSRQTLGFEALLRWKHPQRGYISPALFIPLAEETGQIIQISEWVLHRACRDLQLLNQDNPTPYTVAVNLSPLQFHRDNFIPNLSALLEQYQIPTSQLELELTEGILMGDLEGAIQSLKTLHQLGVRVSIDDFGTGFSSLSYLKHLPISKIKIDRSFIEEIDQPASIDAAIVRGVITMAHQMKLKVVAEGIENAAQQARLKRMGCDIFQGFFLARPMPLAQLQTWLQAQQHAPQTNED